jgi:chloramphenicol O-acetyltransferase type A
MAMMPDRTKIDLTKYPRIGLFNAFKDRQMPCFGVTCNVDITAFRQYIKARDYRFYISMSYVISCAINRVPELRHRLIDDEIYEFERIDPGHTILLGNNTFSFCDSIYFEKFGEYYDDMSRRIDAIKVSPDHGTGEKHHMFFITNVPWFSFTSISHPYDEKYSSIPIIAIGRYFEQGAQLLMPLAIHAHHGLVDGFHLGLFYEYTDQILSEPECLDE